MSTSGDPLIASALALADRLHWSNVRLASELGVNPTHIGRWRKAKRPKHLQPGNAQAVRDLLSQWGGARETPVRDRRVSESAARYAAESHDVWDLVAAAHALLGQVIEARRAGKVTASSMTPEDALAAVQMVARALKAG